MIDSLLIWYMPVDLVHSWDILVKKAKKCMRELVHLHLFKWVVVIWQTGGSNSPQIIQVTSGPVFCLISRMQHVSCTVWVLLACCLRHELMCSHVPKHAVYQFYWVLDWYTHCLWMTCLILPHKESLHGIMFMYCEHEVSVSVVN